MRAPTATRRGAPGLYAVGTIASAPELDGPPAAGRAGWTPEGAALFAGTARYVWVAYHQKLGGDFIPKAVLQAHPVLRSLSIFTPGAAQGTNHALTVEQADALAGLMRRHANTGADGAPPA